MSRVEQSLCLFPALGLASVRPCLHLAHGTYSTNVNSLSQDRAQLVIALFWKSGS